MREKHGRQTIWKKEREEINERKILSWSLAAPGSMTSDTIPFPWYLYPPLSYLSWFEWFLFLAAKQSLTNRKI